ncbi:hypothetical protein AC480_00870 [miscellaneous Crenarchaeota group archaeon SMTZ1-55]|nr:MAG: hypothetical protein AC480_00870 [miscellaneous Crenarchaeota group archaeon SMTZ1-55]
MMFSRLIPYEEITKQLKSADTIAVISCNTCARECGVGGVSRADELVDRLTQDGYTVTEEVVLQDACSEPVYRKARIRLDADTIIVLACSAGIDCVKRMFPKTRVLTVTEDVGLFVTETDLEVFKVALPFSGFKAGAEYAMYTGAPQEKQRIRLEE